ncbi:hypothetical protein ONZ45_g6710 [Pleurotus djamor]|nr:hypothetical protein ONZ45_g6710 [Pleurotus djamor]
MTSRISSFAMTTMSQEDARQLIFEKISKLEDQIISLKRDLNHHSPTAKLPPEILSRIFLLVKSQTRRNYEYPFLRNSDDSAEMGSGWLQLASVSHRWREIALQTPRLWATIDFKYPLHAAEWLERSKSAPLQININLSSSTSDSTPLLSTIKTALSQSSRLSDLKMTFKNDEILGHVLPVTALSTMAPVLEKICLASLEPMLDPPSNTPTIWRDMPSLREIELRNIPFPRHLSALPRLTKFVFTRMESNIHTHISELVRLLRSTPALEYLEVSTLSNKIPSDLTLSMQVSLPRLNHLALRSVDLIGFQFYNLVEFPDAVRLNHTIETIEAHPDPTFSGLRSACSRYPVGPDAPLIPAAHITMTFPLTNIEIKFFPTDSHSPLDPDFRIVLPVPKGNNNSIYAQILQVLPMQQSETLLLECLLNHDLQYLQGLPSSLKHVKTLHLTTCTTSLLQSFLKGPSTQQQTLPALETLVMEDCCEISEDVVTGLGDYVDSVEWDGHEIEENEDEDEDGYGYNIDGFDDFASGDLYDDYGPYFY